MSSEFICGFHNPGETPRDANSSPFDLTDDMMVTDSSSLTDYEMAAPRSKKRLTAIQELAHDAEAAEEYLRQDRQTQLLISLDQESHQAQGRTVGGEPASEPIPFKGPISEGARMKKERPGSNDPTFYSSSPEKGHRQPIYLGQNGVVLPGISCSHDTADMKDSHLIEGNNNAKKEKLCYPVRYGTSSEDEGFSLVNFPSPGSTPSSGRQNVGCATKVSSEKSDRAPTSYSLSSKQLAQDQGHVGDLLHYSPGLGRKPRFSSSLTSAFEVLGVSSEPNEPSQLVFPKMEKNSASIPDISTELLISLDDQEKEDYLETAITRAKMNSEKIGIPFLIMKDGRSCVMGFGEHGIEFIRKPEEWKKSMLAGSKVQPQASTQAQGFDKTILQAKQGTASERVQTAWRVNTSDITLENTSHDITSSSYYSSTAVHSNHSTLSPSFGNEKAHRTLGIIVDTPKLSYIRRDQQSSKNSISSSTTNVSSIMSRPPQSMSSRSMLDVSAGMPSNKQINRSLSADNDTSGQTGSISPYKYGVDSPSRQRKPSPSERSVPVKPARSPDLRKAASFLSDGSRECPVKASLEDVSDKSSKIGRAVTTPEETSEREARPQDKVEADSISSSTYRGDEGCVEDGQMICIYDISANSSTEPPEGVGLIERMEAQNKEKTADRESWLARASARLTSPSDIKAITGKEASTSMPDSGSYEGRMHGIGAVSVEKQPQEPTAVSPFKKAPNPFAGMREPCRMVTADDTKGGEELTYAEPPHKVSNCQLRGDITYTTPLSSNAPTDDERAYAREITKRHAAINEKNRMHKERRAARLDHIEEDTAKTISDADSVKDAKAFGKSPVKNRNRLLRKFNYHWWIKMGKPRLIILIRHAQSEGNKNREIHQKVPDHRVKLTPEGWKQVPSSTLLPKQANKMSNFDPLLRQKKQPNSAEMARMWQERADYGHFFYRIPNGESAADAYDRVSGFNESLWRSFGEEDFASVCVLVTHGLMTRVFLMKWYHFSVEYFEDLRNVNHCEFVIMKLNSGSGKYVLQNQLRTWSEMRRERANSWQEPHSPIPMRKKWGGCADGNGNRGDDFARRQEKRRQNTSDLFADEYAAETEAKAGVQEQEEYPGSNVDDVSNAIPSVDPEPPSTSAHPSPPAPRRRQISPKGLELLKAGRDGGGSRSGAGSPIMTGLDDSDVELTMALNQKLDIQGNEARARADALGDQSDAEDDGKSPSRARR
ncbi:MAG: hypothetical protein Q9163_003439 [Psora crenata]